MLEPDFPPSLRKMAFNAVLDVFLRVYPPELATTLKADPEAFDTTHYLPPQILKARIHMLHALSYFFGAPEAKTPQFMAYVDALFRALLASQVHHLLQTAVIHAICAHLPQTNRNRLRVETYFRPPIAEMTKLMEPPLEQEGEEGSEEAAAAPAQSTPAVTFHPALTGEIARFWAVWYPRAGDLQLVNVKPFPEQMIRIAEGYANRRWQWLLTGNVSMGEDGETPVVDQDAKRLALKKGTNSPYPEEILSHAALKVDFFPSKSEAPVTQDDSPVSAEDETLEDVDIEFDIPDPATLSFNISPPILLFNRHPFKKDIYLQNKSMTHDMSFRLQVGPSRFFQAWPTFGTLPKGESTAITVQFTPCPHIARKSPEVMGFVKVRTVDGLPMERITIRAYNMPALKTFPAKLDFGFCPKTDSRSMMFVITNLLPIECPVVMLVVPSKTGAMFQLASTQIILMPKERKTFQVRFTPTSEGPISDELMLVAFGGEVTRISLVGVCSQTLRVLDTKLDFGPTDIYYNAVVKRVSLMNRDKRCSLPVSFESSTDELIINKGEPIILGPLEEKRVPVEFSSAFTGTRQESLQFRAPHSMPHPIDVIAFSGPAICVPVMENVVFTAAPTGSPASIQFPIVNVTSSVVQCSLTVPPNCPIHFRLVDVEYANRKSNTALTMDFKPYEGPESVGVLLTIGARLTAVVEILFCSATWGSFRIPLTTLMLKPRKWHVATHFLVAMAVNDVYLSRERPVEMLRKFFATPSRELPTGLLKKPVEIRGEESSINKTSSIFELDPPLQTVFGAAFSGRYEDVYEFVALTNVTNAVQRYRIVLSEHFYTDVPLDGEMEPMASVEIPVRLDPSFFDDSVARELRNNVAIGSITIFDEDEKRPGMVTTALHGIMGDLVSLEVREGVDTIKFPPAKVMDKLNRKFLLRNRAPFDITWEGRIVAVGQQGIGLQSDGQPMIIPTSSNVTADWCPFALSTTRLNLKPLEYYTLEVAFQATSSGEYRGKLFMEYVDPVTHVVQNEHLKGKIKRSLKPIVFKCSVGNPELAHMPEFLNFGDVILGEKMPRILSVINNQPLETQLVVVAPPPFNASGLWTTAAKSSKMDVPIHFEPIGSRAYSDLLVLAFGNVTRVIPLFGAGGSSILTSNLAEPIKLTSATELANMGDITPAPANCINFGFVNLAKPKTQLFSLRNLGTFDYSVKSIIVSEDQHVTWKFNGEFGDTMSGLIDGWPEFGSEPLDDMEIDWDEFDVRAHDEGGGRPNPASMDRRSLSTGTAAGAPRRRRYKSISHTPAMPSFAHQKLFPFRLPPFQCTDMLLTFGGYDKGEFMSYIRVEVERSNGEPELYGFWATGNIQPALQLWDKKIEFGVRAVHIRHRSEIKFTNTGSTALSWTLSHERIEYTAVAKFEPPPLPKEAAAIPSPLAIFPTGGKLAPGCTQSVDVTFTPSLAQYEVSSYMKLRTEDFAEAAIVIHGIGASSKLLVDLDALDFGILRVGAKKSYKLKVRNRGILPLKYFVECSDTQFSADPEQGLLEGDGAVEVVVKFVPKQVGQLSAYLRILPHSAEGYGLEPVQVSLKGMGSYPELVVLARTVDFGTALFMTPNVRPIRVQNKGAADAHIVFSCHHPGIRLEGAENGPVVLGPHVTKDINLIYTPQVVELLDIKVFLRSSDSRGDYFMVALKGSVGVPKLTLDPPNIMEDLDLGVCSVNGLFKKTFTMKNDGNISLAYSMTLEPLKTIQAQEGAKPLTPKRPVLTVDPEKGTLPVGETVTVTISFVPAMLAEYEYRFTLNYEFRTSTSVIKGIGGRAILTIQSPLKMLDFGVCRLKRTFRKTITVSNTGNLGVRYHVRPEPRDHNWAIYDDEILHQPKQSRPPSPVKKEDDQTSPGHEVEELVPLPPKWVLDLASQGFTLVNADGYCKPHAETDLIIEYAPMMEDLVGTRLRVFFGDQYEDIDIRGRAALAKLSLYGPSNEPLGGLGQTQTIDLGVHPINSEYVQMLQLVNEGPFGVDFLVQPIGIREFDVRPLRGFIEPDSSVPLKLYFRPTSDNKFQTVFKVLWEREPLRLQVVGSGGIGKLEVAYVEEKDMALNGLDFGMVPFNSSSEKHFFVFNVGMVEITVQAEIDNDEYVMTPLGDPFPAQPPKSGVVPKSPNKKPAWNWYPNIKIALPPQMGLEFAVRFVAKSPTTSAGNINIKSECGSYVISMRGKGGTIQVSHRGDLSFGDISSNFTYTRKITIVNGGSIPATLTAEWLVVGHSSEPAASMVRLTESYSALDPRSGWAKQQLLKDRGEADGSTTTLTAADRWRLIQLMIRKAELLDETSAGTALSKLWGSTLSKIRSAMQRDARDSSAVAVGSLSSSGLHASNASIGGADAGGSADKPPERLRSGQSSSSILQRKGVPAHYSAHFKRRQMFFHLITNTQMTSQSMPTTKPYIKVEPATSLLPSYGETILTVEVNLSTEDTFLATLVVKPSVTNTPPHEIPLTATPKAVNIVCDDTRMLNFHRQPLGETETLTRTFTNVGHKDINFRIVNPNSALTVVPAKGALRVGESVTLAFNLKPVDESLQTADVIFEPDVSQPIKLKFYGGGGYAKSSLSKYRRFDFGHCMIGKDTVSFLPIANEGNAFLHLTRFELFETDTFFRGIDWPTSRVSLFPGKSYNLPIVFNPHEESPPPGRLTIGTNTEAWDIELIGLGREAVLIVSKVALEFAECLIGNSYEQKLGLKNVGDVNYPVTFKLEKEFADIEFIPPSLVINPYTESHVIIAYTPSRETRSTVVLTISSPYSTHKVPLLLHAGTAILEFSSEELDFGMFERSSRPSVQLTMRNVGTVRTSYSVRDVMKPSMFHVSPAKGLLQPGRSTEITVTHTKHEVCRFEERLAVRTDLIDNVYYIKVKGQCEEAILHADEFNLLNMGICPVLDSTSKPLSFTNYGRYPLEYTVKSAYPLKVAPSSGRVEGGDTGTIVISWNPSGGYELRTQISMVTNIGTFNIVVRGKAAFPELAVKNMYLDFGVCAVNHTYKETFNLTNKGKVPINFNIPPVRESSYAVSISQGTLEPKDTLDVDVFFRPTGVGRFANTFIIECKGINYKEVVVIGIGGMMKLDIIPPVLQLGRCPFDLRVYHVLSFANNGDVTLFLDFPHAEVTSGECELVLPDSVIIKPNQSDRRLVGVTAKCVGAFAGQMTVATKERTYTVPFEGVGVKIFLTERSKRILRGEDLPVLQSLGPFGREIQFGDLDSWLKKMSKRYQFDVHMADILSTLYVCAQSETGEAWSTVSSRLLNELTAPVVTLAVAGEAPSHPPGGSTEASYLPTLGPVPPILAKAESAEADKAPSAQPSQPSTHSSTPANETPSITQESPNPSPVVEPKPAEPPSESVISTPLPPIGTSAGTETPPVQTATSASAEHVTLQPRTPSAGVINIPSPMPLPDTVAIRAVISDDEDVGEVEPDPSVPPVSSSEPPTIPVVAPSPPLAPAESQSSLPSKPTVPASQHAPAPVTAPRQSVVSSEPLLGTGDAELTHQRESDKKRAELLAEINGVRVAPESPKTELVEKLVEKFLSIKTEEFQRLPSPPDDPIVHEVLDYANLKVDQIDLAPIVDVEEPDVLVDLSLVTDRPRPIAEEETTTAVVKVQKDHKREFAVFLSLNRRERNAHTVDFYRHK
ncbi:hypothetical protein HK104_002087 [Borealophlyctis nickersoniae]|nr:hypothetical protein HK104_002087 [Borealophlyctis nickersoniae]